MKRVFLGPFIGCLLCIVTAAPAHAATPGAVKIRVEGASQTLVPTTTVTTTTAPVDKAGHPCSGTSAGGALQIATNGDWSGSFDPNFGQAVETILGESHTFSSQTYYALYVNNVASSTGICTTELQTGDSVLLYAACAGATSNCIAGEPLDVIAPVTAAPGTPFELTVNEVTTTFGGPPDYLSTTTDGPSSDATVTAAGVSKQTDANGKVSFASDTRGPLTLTATKGNRVREAVSVCITDGADGFCGTTKPGAPPPPPCLATNGHDGKCGTTDTTPAWPLTAFLTEKQHFAGSAAPRTLSGTVTNDPSGIKDIRLALSRNNGGACSRYDGATTRWVKLSHCGAKYATQFSVGNRASWSYLLPSALRKGRYVLDIQVTDGAGNVTVINKLGRDRFIFYVD